MPKVQFKYSLNNDKIEDMKESLTFLLNEPEFEQVILCEDRGYPKHQTLRKRMQKIWSKNKNFKNLLDEAALILK